MPYKSFEIKLEESQEHKFPAHELILPWIEQPSQAPGLGEQAVPVRLPLFPNSRLPDTLSLIDQVLLHDITLDILYFFNGTRSMGIKFLFSLNENGKESMEHLFTETIFSQMFRLPKPPFRNLYYGALFIELCKNRRETFPPVLAEAIRILYDRLEELDVECFCIFTDWFAFHLSNFDYKWNWNDWVDVVDKEDSRQYLFIKEALERAVRLSYFERIQRTIPEELHPLMPEKSAPNFAYSNESSEFYASAKTLFTKMKSKESAEDLKSWLDDEVYSSNKFLHSDKISLIVNCLLLAGSKSFSHLLNFLERYILLLKSHISDNQQQMQCINVIHNFWRTSPQNVIIVLNKFLTYRVLDPTSIANWVFSEPIITLGKRQYIWEILNKTVDRTIDSVSLGEQKLTEMDDPSVDSTEEEIKNFSMTKDKLEQAKDEKKMLFQVIFQRFSMVLNEYLQSNASKDDNWFKMTLGMLKSIGRKYYKHIKENLTTLDLLFANVDPQIADAWKQCKHLAQNY